MKKRSTKVTVDDKTGVAFFNVNFDNLKFVYVNINGDFALIRKDKIQVIEGSLDELDMEDWS